MLWIPGPTQVRPEILDELKRPMIGHRSSAMTELIERLDPGLRLAFGLTPGSSAMVGVATHSASGMMEGSLHGAGERVLCAVNGAFSKRWRDIALTLGKDVTSLEFPLGAAVDADELQRTIEEKGPFDAVTLVVNETSTGVRTPLRPIGKALEAHPRTLLLVDVVSALGGYAVDFEAHGIDFALAGVNKALALPPGITVLCASQAYMDRAHALDRPTWYLDPVLVLEGHRDRKTPATPCIPLYYALARQLEDISDGRTLPTDERGKSGSEAWRARYAKHERMRTATLEWGRRHAFETFPPTEFSSPTVTCFRAGSLDVKRFLGELKKRGHQIGNGYGSLKGETFRIGHMGDHTDEGLAQLLQAADEALAVA